MKGRNSHMTMQSSSLPAANSARDEWRRYAAFLKSPRLPARADGIDRPGLRAVLRIYGLDMLIMASLLLLAGIVVALGFELPENELADLDLNIAAITLIVLAAPLLEELAFRSWLSGRPGHLLAGALIALASSGIALVATDRTVGAGDTSTMIGAGIFVTAIMLALIVLLALRRRDAMGWFARLFPVFFWASALGFALLHLFNYQQGTLAMLLPLVVPQFILGSMLGYVRVRHGLWSSILLHALHNGTIIALVLLATGLAD